MSEQDGIKYIDVPIIDDSYSPHRRWVIKRYTVSEYIKMNHEKIKKLEARIGKLRDALEFECENRCSDLNPCNAKETLKQDSEAAE